MSGIASKAIKCLICEKIVTVKELEGIAVVEPQRLSEFKCYPAHEECFNGFASAEEFLEFIHLRLKDKNEDFCQILKGMKG